MDVNNKEQLVLELRAKGYSYGDIVKETRLNKSTVAYLAKKQFIEKEITKSKAKLDYEEIVCSIIPNATSMCDLCKLLGKRPTNNNYLFLTKIIEKYNIDISHFSSLSLPKHKSRIIIDDSQYFIHDPNQLKQGIKIKQRLLKHNIKEHKCEKCGRTHWNDDIIPLELHHVNGDRFDNRLENLQLLCPNCHSQTDNFCGKNILKEKKKYTCRCCGKEFFCGEGSSKYSRLYCSEECRDTFSGMPNQYVKRTESNKTILAINIKISKEQLLEDYKELGSFVKIGEKYNVSDNTIKKWFKKYNLPCKSIEIRKLIIEQYGKQPQWYVYMYDENGKRKNMQYKKIDTYTMENEFIKTYDSVKDVCHDLNLVSIDSIRDVCVGKKSSYRGYIFKYHKD